MSAVFDAYAAYYDLLYRDKDYGAEASYVLGLLSDQGIDAGHLLDLGCGAGRHAQQFARRGFQVHGVDLSPQMIAAAEQQRTSELSPQLNYIVGDIRSLALLREFDAVVSLFHVASYQIRNSDLKAMFSTASRHLTQSGVFVFDFWYGPAVLADPPEIRIRRMDGPQVHVTRIAQPEAHPDINVIDVNYEILVADKETTRTSTFREQHRMRYLFMPELEDLLESAGLTIVLAEKWLGGQLGKHSWNGVVVARRTPLRDRGGK